MPYLSCPNCRLRTPTTATWKKDEQCARCSSRVDQQGTRFGREDLLEQAAAPAPSPSASPTPRGEGAVLLVDDERSMRELTRRLLSRHGHEVAVADSPGAALRVFASRPHTIDLLLTDLVMPGMSGRELAQRLRQLRRDLPIVYMSGNPSGILDLGEALPPGTSFLAKPFSVQRLLAAVQEALGADRAAPARLASR